MTEAESLEIKAALVATLILGGPFGIALGSDVLISSPYTARVEALQQSYSAVSDSYSSTKDLKQDINKTIRNVKSLNYVDETGKLHGALQSISIFNQNIDGEDDPQSFLEAYKTIEEELFKSVVSVETWGGKYTFIEMLIWVLIKDGTTPLAVAYYIFIFSWACIYTDILKD